MSLRRIPLAGAAFASALAILALAGCKTESPVSPRSRSLRSASRSSPRTAPRTS